MKKFLTKRRSICFAVIGAVVIVPLLYSYFYLGAFWDPYSKLEKLPVAVVNLDDGAVVNQEERNFGDEMCNKLTEEASLKFVLTEEAAAKAGTEGKEYYAMIVIPKDFSADIASASREQKQTATITYSPNEKRNYLSSQILSRVVLEIEESLRASVDKALVEELSDHMKAVPDQMVELSDGLSKLEDGAMKLNDGATTLSKGSETFQDKFVEYSIGVSSARNGASSLETGAKTLDEGLTKLQSGANTLTNATKEIDQLSAGAKTLAAGADTFNESLITYTDGVEALISSVNDTQMFLKQYATTVNPAIMKDPVFAGFLTKLSDPSNTKSIAMLQAASGKLKEASAQISTGADKLSDGTASLPELKLAIISISNGIEKAKEGSLQLSTGASSLHIGLVSISQATTKLTDGVAELSDGAATLSSGTKELYDGVSTANNRVEEAISDANKQIDTLEGLAEFAEDPVRIQQENITSIPNYGTAFAPYFMSLSLWVGALILFVGIYLDSEGKFQILSKTSEHKIARSFIYLMIGFIQAIALAAALIYGLGLKVDNVFLYYVSCCLVSMVFISIVQFLMVHLKDVGKLLSIVLLILQLTSCGGTFPMETVPKLFNVLYPYMPMTYSVGLFKQVISDPNTKDILYNGGILIAILIIFMSLTILLSILKIHKPAKVNLVADYIVEK